MPNFQTASYKVQTIIKHYSPDAELYLNQNQPSAGYFLSFGPHPKAIDGLTLSESRT